MLTKEQNNLLTQTGPGTPGGDLLRRYWQPVALAEELPPGGAPIAVRILSEDLVLFRDDQGRIGLLGLHCSHRGADLSYGRLEDGGLRCLYHGWLYDVAGNCLEQPGEPAGSDFCRKIHQLSYPCQEVADVIFAYLGPGEPPLLPAYEALTAPMEKRCAVKGLQECNYLQANEGNIDPVHLSFLHRFLQDTGPRMVSGTEIGYYSLLGQNLSPTIELEETDFGIRIFAVREAAPGTNYLRVSNFVLPNLSAIPGQTGGDGYSLNWHVPIDDTHHWKYVMTFQRSGPIDADEIRRQHQEEMVAGYDFRRNKSNRYLQDREEMKTRTFIGMGKLFMLHDKWVTEGEGPVQDRTQEHLSSTDKAIAAARQMMLRGIKDLEAGREPPHVVHDPAANDFRHIVVMSEALPSSADWRNHWKEGMARAEATLTKA